MKQFALFKDTNEGEKDEKYTSKIKGPLYEPKNVKPHILELLNTNKSKRLINEINNSNLEEEEKKFLKFAAQRHNQFNYANIADYYAHSSKEMQDLMEKSALVIIDFDKSYQYGYTKLAFDVANQYLDNYGE